ncbi:hypothetical protein M569_12609 [Genlisea aurea]|uniref:Uncharacterized protein n=1 Tax=Genlisea aurea TaxID=192259 RepID=S8C5T1_9LAMI|nr:hypothetical protein M569_12609 [Genlisea aurea]
MESAGARFCPLFCFRSEYMTCPSTGYERLPPQCNCCLAGPGCKIYGFDGRLLCAEPEAPRLPPRCNCCLAGPGCKIHGFDGRLLCAEPEVPYP